MDAPEVKLALTRIDRFRDRVEQRILGPRAPLEAAFAPAKEPLSFETAAGMALSPLLPGGSWGKEWETAWIRLRGQVPAAWAGACVVAQIDLGGEGLVYGAGGKILQGISSGSVWAPEFKRDLVPLIPRAAGGEAVELWVAASANALFGLFARFDPEADAPDRYGQYAAVAKSFDLRPFHTDQWDLWLDLKVLQGLLRGLPPESVRRARLLHAASRMIDAVEGEGLDLSEGRAMLGRELYRGHGETSLNVAAVGHAHIDTAWLWPVEETKRKCARTFASQLDLLERYPGYVFGASQAQHYAWVKELYPEIYRRIRAAVAEGRWEIQGGMWVEADCNLAGGESLVRQILHGKNFFLDEFGVEVDNLWLPDVFGYSAALPQILRKSGIRSFLTQKLSWNQYNEFPHHSFVWAGLDGSRVVAHFPPENTYNSMLDTEGLIRAGERFREKGILDEFMCLFGVGDGGGGPKDEQCALGERLRDVEGVPRVRFDSAREFFHRLTAREDQLPVWVGELYLELHRGTLTTQARVKRLNRSLEQKLRAVEMIWACLPLTNYPSFELDAIWKTVLRNQFHDILPGSSITRVYRETEAELTEASARCDRLLAQAGERLAPPEPDSILLMNHLGVSFDGPCPLPEGWLGHGVEGEDGAVLPMQWEEGRAVVRARLAPFSFTRLRRIAGEVPPAETREAAAEPRLILENERVRYELSVEGTLLRGFDKEEEREILEPGQVGNLLSLYHDHPNDWDAWDVDLAYEKCLCETARAVRIRRLPGGAVRQSLEFSLTVGRSELRQAVRLAEGSKRLDFETTADWREKHKMLRVSFPVRVRSERAGFDVQFGFVFRPTHRNTTWDQARFEVAAHRYADLSDSDYGVALLNDCKYGHKVCQGTLDLCLLRAPTYPDPDADQGEHRFTYSLLPHRGDLAHSEVIAQASILNAPPLLLDRRGVPTRDFPWALRADGISCEAFKKAEKEEALILRLVETQGRRTRGELLLRDPGWTVTPVDLMERAEGEALPHAGAVPLLLEPFEIRTYLLSRAEDGRNG